VKKEPLKSAHRFKAGDVVVTKTPYNLGGRHGWADPGWKWRIVKVYHVGVRAYYDCVAHTAPKVYACTLEDRQVDGKHQDHRS
jgi:hypothetical protein